jgi:phosphate transport system substrate-binding protein
MTSLLRFSLAALLLPTVLSAQTVIRLNGSDTLTRKLSPFAAEVGQANNVELKFEPNGVGNGVADLAAGRAEVAMVIGPLEYFAGLLNEKTPGAVDVAKMKQFPLPEKFAAPGILVVHPDIPVEKLTRDQVREIFSGVITNWSKVGGPDLPIVPVLQQPMDGYMATMSVVFVHGTPKSPNAKKVVKSAEICAVVAATPGAIGYLSKTVAQGATGVKLMDTTPSVVPPSNLVTVGDPTGPTKAVVDALVSKAQ